MTIPIFSAERSAGLEGKIIGSTKAVSFAPIKFIEPFDFGKIEGSSHFKSEDLHFLDSILVTTGWNNNDDVFIPYETWSARKTPEDKQFNYGHDCSDIIGHIIDVYPVDNKYNIIADNTSLDELPDRFHLLTKAVLYKSWSKDELQERMDNIIKEIPEGVWFVSMEALFNNFDYGMIDASGNQTIVNRNEETAFLTSHLRAYGGSGTYNNCKVGRIVRNITFSGKGLVKNPANPDSIIFAERNSFVCNKIFDKKEKLGYKLTEESTLDLEKSMASENDKIIEQLKAENEDLKTKLAEVDVKSLKDDLAKAEDKNKSLTDKLKEYENVSAEKDELEKKLEKSNSEVEELKAQVVKIETEKKTNDRLSVVKSKLGMEDKVAAEFVEATISFDDEKFNKQVKAVLTIKKSESEDDLPETDKGEGAAKVDLEKAEAEKQTALVTENENSSEELRKAIAARYMGDK